VKIRQEKVDLIANHIPALEMEQGEEEGDVLVLGWGSTYGASRTAVRELLDAGLKVSQAHFRFLNPFPKNTAEVLSKFKKIIIPEINNGQLVHIINGHFNVNAVGFSKVQGMPFTSTEIKENVLSHLQNA
jgi:2-oxoglutarate ferredoxin oxidoreductase subunit alpha